ncbi:MAG: hypothetical protein BWY79_01976 [Actinobacteria bacterium ADurb.Bin444]|nr:MAG: hypothetical protein BWY79_01976 [Actinobacteria bacterium ADurb.Bin444]
MRYLTASSIMKLISPLLSVVPLMSSELIGVETMLIPSRRSMRLEDGVCSNPCAETLAPGIGAPNRVSTVNLTLCGGYCTPSPELGVEEGVSSMSCMVMLPSVRVTAWAAESLYPMAEALT